jgi:hypothetical protein
VKSPASSSCSSRRISSQNDHAGDAARSYRAISVIVGAYDD